jgi:putative membrane protein
MTVRTRGPRPVEIDPARARVELIEEEPSAAAGPSALTPVAPPPAVPPPRARWPLRLFLGAGGLFLLAVLVLEAVWFVDGLFAWSAPLAWTFATLLALTFAGAVGYVGREVAGVWRLGRLAELRERGRHLLASEVHGEADAVLAPVERLYAGRPDLAPALAAFRAEADPALNDAERTRLFARRVLAPLDRQAYRLVLRAARDVGVLTALSPLGLLDGLLVVGRTLAMLRAVARLYGFRPGYAGTIGLLRRSVRNMALAGLGEVVSDATTEALGASLAGLLSAKAGQGVMNGVLCARLGLAAMEQCRPLPFLPDELPTMRRLRAELFEQAGAP